MVFSLPNVMFIEFLHLDILSQARLVLANPRWALEKKKDVFEDWGGPLLSMALMWQRGGCKASSFTEACLRRFAHHMRIAPVHTANTHIDEQGTKEQNILKTINGWQGDGNVVLGMRTTTIGKGTYCKHVELRCARKSGTSPVLGATVRTFYSAFLHGSLITRHIYLMGEFRGLERVTRTVIEYNGWVMEKLWHKAGRSWRQINRMPFDGENIYDEKGVLRMHADAHTRTITYYFKSGITLSFTCHTDSYGELVIDRVRYVRDNAVIHEGVYPLSDWMRWASGHGTGAPHPDITKADMINFFFVDDCLYATQGLPTRTAGMPALKLDAHSCATTWCLQDGERNVRSLSSDVLFSLGRQLNPFRSLTGFPSYDLVGAREMGSPQIIPSVIHSPTALY